MLRYRQFCCLWLAGHMTSICCCLISYIKRAINSRVHSSSLKVGYLCLGTCVQRLMPIFLIATLQGAITWSHVLLSS